MTTILFPVTQRMDGYAQGRCKSLLGQSDKSTQGDDVLEPVEENDREELPPKEENACQRDQIRVAVVASTGPGS